MMSSHSFIYSRTTGNKNIDKFLIDWQGMGEISYGSKLKTKNSFKLDRSLHEYISLNFLYKYNYYCAYCSIYVKGYSHTESIIGLGTLCTR